MEFTIDTHNNFNGEVVVEDLSIRFGEYFPETGDYRNTEYLDDWKKFRYSESVSIDALYKVAYVDQDKPGFGKLISFKVNDHKCVDIFDKEVVTFNVHEDGYYILRHHVIPTLEWKQEVGNAFLDQAEYANVVWYDREKEVVVITEKGDWHRHKHKEISVNDFITLIDEGGIPMPTTVYSFLADIFYTGLLECCLYSYAREVFDLYLGRCKSSIDKEAFFNRDFVWMTLNIINYLVEFKLYFEALRILEIIIGCGGFCQSSRNFKERRGCGCAKVQGH